jgi:hypothetical protein
MSEADNMPNERRCGEDRREALTDRRQRQASTSDPGEDVMPNERRCGEDRREALTDRRQRQADTSAPGADNMPDDRRGGVERRKALVDRRQHQADTSAPGFVERRSGKDRRQSVVDRRLGLDRCRGPGRRRSDDRKSAEEGHMSDEQFEFLMAIDEYKRANAKPFPTWTEVLEVIKALGYRKVAAPQPLAEARRHEKEQPGPAVEPEPAPAGTP